MRIGCRFARVAYLLYVLPCVPGAFAAHERPSAPSSPAAIREAETLLPRIRVAEDSRGFALDRDGGPFVPWGFNYDHDQSGRLIEDYWESEWARVEEDFAEMRALGANVVRIHLQVARFLEGPRTANRASLARLRALLDLAAKERLYLDLTGLGCYHKADVPEWYDRLSEVERWRAQAAFWDAIARTCTGHTAVFCYDLMNEPVVPGGRRAEKDWLGPPFGGKHFVQVITLDQAERPRPAIAREWIRALAPVIRRHDPKALVTVGLVDWSLDRPGLTSGFVPSEIAGELDFLCIHLYPKQGQVDAALETLAGFARAGKPVVIEETFPLACPPAEFATFIERSREHAAGWIGFYWGATREELAHGKTIGDAITRQWLEFFATRSAAMRQRR